MGLQADLPPWVSVEEIGFRLKQIFPEGTPNRNYVTRELCAKTVFVMLYVGAVEKSGVYMRPDQVVRMSDEQSGQNTDRQRLQWRQVSLRPKKEAIAGRWYAANTREPIRDETLRQGLITLNAVCERTDLPTTSSKPRYALRLEFAALFSPSLRGSELKSAISAWRDSHLGTGALARTELVRKAMTTVGTTVRVEFPNGESRLMAPGPSSIVSKAVIEEFAPQFLKEPCVVWLSESGNKVVARDDGIANSIGLEIAPDRHLPDIILADLAGETTLLVFVEVVATDGAITEDRKKALESSAAKAGFGPQSVAFVTAFLDRESSSFRKCISVLAWHSFAWLASEPENLIVLHDGSTCRLRLGELLARSES